MTEALNDLKSPVPCISAKYRQVFEGPRKSIPSTESPELPGCRSRIDHLFPIAQTMTPRGFEISSPYVAHRVWKRESKGHMQPKNASETVFSPLVVCASCEPCLAGKLLWPRRRAVRLVGIQNFVFPGWRLRQPKLMLSRLSEQ